MPETPKPGDQAFARVTLELIASNRLALEAAAKRAAELGLAPKVSEDAARRGGGGRRSECSRDTVTTLRFPRHPATGGEWRRWTAGVPDLGRGDHRDPGARAGGSRRPLPGAGARGRPRVWAAPRRVWPCWRRVRTAGTDRPTLPARSWTAAPGTRFGAQGRDPARDLAAHDAYRALDAAGSLLKPGLTGTNVMDLVIGVCSPGPA